MIPSSLYLKDAILMLKNNYHILITIQVSKTNPSFWVSKTVKNKQNHNVEFKTDKISILENIISD